MTARAIYDYDVAVIGGGSGGYAAARTTAAAGLRTTVIEGAAEVGGLCILRGCMPTKALLQSAEVYHLASHPQAWGIQPGKVGFDFQKVMARKDALVREFADYRRGQLSDGRFAFLRAEASFEDPHTLRLSTGGRITAAHFVIATGSRVSAPPIPDLATLDCLTSDTALELRALPKSLAVLGGGAVALEFAQFFARFGVQVSLVQRSAHVLRDFDPDAAEVLETVLRREGIALFANTRLTGASRQPDRKTVHFEHAGKPSSVTADEVLLATGRSANIDSLHLDRAGVELRDGRIAANERMQTSAPHIYAAGDCTGPYEIVHLAVLQGEIAGHNIAQPARPRLFDTRLLTVAVFTEPQAAFVGLTERAAQARGIPYVKASYPFGDHGKSIILEARDGFVKLLADPKSGEILGGACVGPQGAELIHEIVVAMAKRMTARELAATPHYHPTLAEIWTYPAEELAEMNDE
ncbi:MAG: dihydrolipoyl dehydrogenase [Verrucomicrobiota bacterium]